MTGRAWWARLWASLRKGWHRLAPFHGALALALLAGLGTLPLLTAWPLFVLDLLTASLLVVTLGGLGTLTGLLILRPRRRVDRYTPEPHRLLWREGLAYYLWFACFHLAGIGLALALSLGMLWFFGPRLWVLMFCSGLHAFSLLAALGLIARPRAGLATLGLLWRTNQQQAPLKRIGRLGASLFLSRRYEQGLLQDQQQDLPVLVEITRALDVARIGARTRALSLWRDGFERWPGELRIRLWAAVSVAGPTMALALLMILILPRAQLRPEFLAGQPGRFNWLSSASTLLEDPAEREQSTQGASSASDSDSGDATPAEETEAPSDAEAELPAATAASSDTQAGKRALTDAEASQATANGPARLAGATQSATDTAPAGDMGQSSRSAAAEKAANAAEAQKGGDETSSQKSGPPESSPKQAAHPSGQSAPAAGKKAAKSATSGSGSADSAKAPTQDSGQKASAAQDGKPAVGKPGVASAATKTGDGSSSAAATSKAAKGGAPGSAQGADGKGDSASSKSSGSSGKAGKAGGQGQGQESTTSPGGADPRRSDENRRQAARAAQRSPGGTLDEQVNLGRGVAPPKSYPSLGKGLVTVEMPPMEERTPELGSRQENDTRAFTGKARSEAERKGKEQVEKAADEGASRPVIQRIPNWVLPLLGDQNQPQNRSKP